MINRYPSNDHSGHVANVKVIDIEKRYKPGSKHYVYVIQVTWSNPTNTFIIYRRYAQFFDLHCKLLDLFAETPQGTGATNLTQQRQIPFLPGKIILGRSQIRVIALERKRALNEYCQRLIALPERISQARPVLDFFQPSPTDVQPPLQSISDSKKPSTNSPIVISSPTKLPTYRCLDTFVACDKTEMSLRRNTIVQVIEKHINGWWFVQNGDRTGFVPGPYLEPSEQAHGAREVKTFRTSLNETYVVNHTYQAKNRDELSLDKGSFVTVLEKSFTGWWTIKFNHSTGQFPAVYLTNWEGRIGPEISRQNSSTISSSTNPMTYFRESILGPTASNNHATLDDEDEETTNSSTMTEPILFYAHSDFKDDIGDSVSFQRGDIIEIHQKHPSGWWFGRPLKNKNILTWIPSNYLQEEPIDDAYIDSQPSLFYKNMPDIVRDHAIEQPQKIADDIIYQNVENQSSSHVIYAQVAPKQQPLTEPMASKDHPPPPPPSLPVIEEQEPRNVSVRELVKKFSRQ